MWGTRVFARRTVVATEENVGSGAVVVVSSLLNVVENPHTKIRRVGHPAPTFSARNGGVRVLRADDNSAR